MKSSTEEIAGLAEKLDVEVQNLSEVTLWLGSRMLEGEIQMLARFSFAEKCSDKY